MTHAQKELFLDLLVGVIMKTPMDGVGGKSIADALNKDVSKFVGSSGIYRTVDTIIHSPELKKETMRTLAKRGLLVLKCSHRKC